MLSAWINNLNSLQEGSLMINIILIVDANEVVSTLVILLRDIKIEIEREPCTTARLKIFNVVQPNALLINYLILEKHILVNKYTRKDKKIVFY